jgi:hypothetical protein
MERVLIGIWVLCILGIDRFAVQVHLVSWSKGLETSGSHKSGIAGLAYLLLSFFEKLLVEKIGLLELGKWNFLDGFW